MKFKILLLCFSCLVINYSCTLRGSSSISQTNDNTIHVNPFIGTGGHGHTYPGATTPHGMVQLSPDTRTLGWDACGGYQLHRQFNYRVFSYALKRNRN